MTDEPEIDELPADTLDSLAAMLSRSEVWSEPSDGIEDRVVDQILRAGSAATSSTIDQLPESEPGTGIDELAARRTMQRGVGRPSPPRRRRGPMLLAAAAAFLVAALGTLAVLRLASTTPADQLVALEGAGRFSDATATAEIREDGNGISIVLVANGLPAAPEGSFYAAWVVPDDAPARVPVGTFHLRADAEEPIELWSGVDIATHPRLTVTLQSEAAPMEPGERVLAGRID